MKKTGLYGTVCDFSVDNGAMIWYFNDILSIHKYLIKKQHSVNEDV